MEDIMLEYCKKLLLYPEEYEILFQITDHVSSPTVFSDYYYDSYDYKMNRESTTYSIRQKSGKNKVTISKYLSDKEILLIGSFEDDENINNQRMYKDTRVILQGNSTTLRIEIYSSEGIVIYIDRNEYLGTTDYELGISYDHKAEENVNTLLCDIARLLYANINEKYAKEFCNRTHFYRSKYQRLLNRKTLTTSNNT